MRLSVAIVGSGPSGFYAAESLLSAFPDCEIDILERLPTPFGLVRFGVAPDHQSVKRVTEGYEKTVSSGRVHYYGNVEVGCDVTMAELRDCYDAVVLAVGAPRDRPIGIPGEDKRGILGSAAFVGWYNGHPDFANLHPNIDVERAIVVGNGNVALDIARILVLSPNELAATDIAEEAADAITRSKLREVIVLGRRGAAQARFTNPELRAFARLDRGIPSVEGDNLSEHALEGLSEKPRRQAERNLETLRGFAELKEKTATRRITFRFFARPLEVLGGESVTELRIAQTRLEGSRVVETGAQEDLSCGLIIKAIGYRSPRIPGIPFDAARGRLRNRDGRIAPGLYAVGWAKRGPSGVIGTNKADGKALAEQLRDDMKTQGKPGRKALEERLTARQVRWVTYRDWRLIDEAEIAAGQGDHPRRKFVSVADMLALLDRAQENTT